MLKKLLILLILPLLLLQGCIKDEALELEADIIGVHDTQESFLMNPIVTNNKVIVYVKPGDRDLTNYHLKFDLTKGATIDPIPESVADYTKEVTYTVTSESGQYKKKYIVRVVESDKNTIPDEFTYENYDFDENQGIVFFDVINGERYNNWSSGNGGYGILLGGQEPSSELYPTSGTADSRTGGHAIYMETKTTGDLGALFGSPMAAGNHFIGSFDVLSALAGAKKATRFGLPFNRIPESLEGYYKYKAASPVLMPNPDASSAEKLIPTSLVDSCNIYAVFYNRKEVADRGERAQGIFGPGPLIEWLDGDNIMTDPSIVAIAELKDGSTTTGDGFVHFNAPFVFRKQYNEDDVYAMDYNLAIVMTSSKRGDEFTGALGSVLIVDEIKINTK